MISKESLRIGNLVQTKRGKMIEVVSIQMDGINTESGDIYPKYSSEDIDGIPLSEDWLKKCGFVIGAGPATGFYAGVNGIAIQQAGNDWWVCLRGHEDYQLIRPVNFVHELQNCGFILTDQDLKIEL